VRLGLDEAKVSRGRDWFGRSEFYFGVSIKPRFVDFDLFRQSPEAENCYGPFHEDDRSDGPPELEGELRKALSGAGSGEWPFKVGGTGFDAVLRVAVQPDQ
jgi:hypothetical protein